MARDPAPALPDPAPAAHRPARAGWTRARRAAALAAAALAVFALGWGAGEWWARGEGPRESRRVRYGKLRLVSPLLDVELPPGYTVRHEPIPFQFKVRRFVEEQIAAGRVRDMSVYYRDLLDGPWFGVNEARKYNPASMMKVPILVAWLKRAERDPAVLRSTYVFSEANYPGRSQFTVPQKMLEDGGRYTVEELLRYMLAYSDNKAMWVLYSRLQPDEIDDVLESMDVTNEPEGDENAMTVYAYSGFFRILFNASYLNREMSEKALELLAMQDFPRGIVAGVPKGVTVASKFGEFTGGRPGEVQLHEFGIVYHPRGPYILGVMTIGTDWERQAKVLRDLSALIYLEIESQAVRAPAR